MKPKTWQECPEEVLRKLLENIELDYDSYESSRAETLDAISYGSVSQTNKHRLARAWGNLTNEDFSKMLLSSIWDLEHRLAQLKYNAAFNKWLSCSDSELKEAETNLDICRSKYYQN